ncbi:hypothetical protein Trydic_g6443 [Trypoxylus dichotomus]
MRLTSSWTWKSGLLEELIMFRRHLPGFYRVCLFGIAHPPGTSSPVLIPVTVAKKRFMGADRAYCVQIRRDWFDNGQTSNEAMKDFKNRDKCGERGSVGS